jgi:hypothetical protein
MSNSDVPYTTPTDDTDYKALYELTRQVSSENYAKLVEALERIDRLERELSSRGGRIDVV